MRSFIAFISLLSLALLAPHTEASPSHNAILPPTTSLVRHLSPRTSRMTPCANCRTPLVMASEGDTEQLHITEHYKHHPYSLYGHALHDAKDTWRWLNPSATYPSVEVDADDIHTVFRLEFTNGAGKKLSTTIVFVRWRKDSLSYYRIQGIGPAECGDAIEAMVRAASRTIPRVR